MTGTPLAKEVQYLRRNIFKETQGQAEVIDVDDNLEYVMLRITPTDGLYRGAVFKFKVRKHQVIHDLLHYFYIICQFHKDFKIYMYVQQNIFLCKPHVFSQLIKAKKKKKDLFPVSRPILFFGADP